MRYVINFSGLILSAVLVLTPLLWWISKKRGHKRLQKSATLVFAFFAAGFVMAWLLLGVYAAARAVSISLSTTPLLFLCPTSILSMGLDNASWPMALLGWLIIALTNAGLYSVVGFVVGIVMFPLWKIEDSTQPLFPIT